ncbi:hypothetical protein QTO34_017415 [Cnephaeus nilssonii]|uniref:Uncharacterized protein n=1 Tax=Cnephaeus nilssonii TaxID=3371016 RepID=A0AA40I1S4_CNENI|nr:hypothetical protein QTO34_017415 [Eptesicus nilssonii]
MDKPRPGKTTFVIMVSPLPGSGLGPGRQPWAPLHPASLLRIAGADPGGCLRSVQAPRWCPRPGKPPPEAFPALGSAEPQHPCNGFLVGVAGGCSEDATEDGVYEPPDLILEEWMELENFPLCKQELLVEIQSLWEKFSKAMSEKGLEAKEGNCWKRNYFELYIHNSKQQLIEACKTEADGQVIEESHVVYWISASTEEEKEE